MRNCTRKNCHVYTLFVAANSEPPTIMCNVDYDILEVDFNINTNEYGALYNWYAATDEKKITSSNEWIIPFYSDVVILTKHLDIAYNPDDPDYMQHSIIAGGKLKETGTTFWNSPNIGATNETGFNARGSGFRGNQFDNITQLQIIFLIDLEEANDAKCFQMDSGSSWLLVKNNYSGAGKIQGNSIRLLYTGVGAPTSYTGNDGRVYRVVLIGTQYWLADNLNETQYRNGNWITGFDGGVYTPISNANWAAKTTEAMCYYDNIEFTTND